MKTRNGFVSNSSSSSFIVVFPRQPTSCDDVFNMMFESKSFFIDGYHDPITTSGVAQMVWGDLQEQLPRLPLSRPYITQQLWDVAVDYRERRRLQATGELQDPWEVGLEPREHDRRRRLEDEYFDKQAGLLADAFLRDNQDSFICSFEYSDDDGAQGSTMEHGDIFRNLPHHRISNH